MLLDSISFETKIDILDLLNQLNMDDLEYLDADEDVLDNIKKRSLIIRAITKNLSSATNFTEEEITLSNEMITEYLNLKN